MEYNYHKNAGQLAFIKFVKGLVHLLIRPKVEWKDKSLKKSLKSKPVVFVCNHTHHFDGVVISSVLSKYKPYMLVKKSWYDKSGTGSFIRICRSIPVDFDTMDTNWYAQSEGAVENGYSMLIFPEGGIAREGKMLPFKPGAALLAAKKGLDIIPIASLGEYKILFGKRQKILIGNPIKSECPENVRCSKYAKEISAEAEKQVKKLYLELEEKYGKGKVYYFGKFIIKSKKIKILSEVIKMNNAIADQIKEMLVENLRIPENILTYDSELFGDEIGLDSIDSIEIVAGIDTLFGIDMTGADREHFQSIRALTEYVESKQG